MRFWISLFAPFIINYLRVRLPYCAQWLYINRNFFPFLNLKVVSIALSCIRTIDGEHMPYLLRFLLLSATPVNVWRIISQIREQLKFVGVSNSRASQNSKIKGKSLVNNTDASILDALRSSLRFKNVLPFSLLCCSLENLLYSFY